MRMSVRIEKTSVLGARVQEAVEPYTAGIGRNSRRTNPVLIRRMSYQVMGHRLDVPPLQYSPRMPLSDVFRLNGNSESLTHSL
jgi:hypothetical protein